MSEQIKPPFYKTWGFWLVVLVVLLALFLYPDTVVTQQN
jgi:hypothetical protein